MLKVKSRVARIGQSNCGLLYLPASLLSEFLSPIHVSDLPCETTIEIDGSTLVVRKLCVNSEVETLE
jgi:hypothetical protein